MPTLRSEAAFDRLRRLHPKLIDLSLCRIERLLERLDHPESRLPPVIHVAGTNGKGSVVAFLTSICEAAGLSVHAYTSPHLVRFHERIVVAGKPIDEQALCDVLDACERANDGEQITFFEVTTAAAFLAFARTPADIALIETGLGGRFDATNVIEQPAACAITPISIDHVQFLGTTLEAIAFEKAGILKPGVTCVVGPQSAGASGVIDARAAEIGAPLARWPTDWCIEDMTYRDGGGAFVLPQPALIGRHQVENAGIATACIRRLVQLRIDDDAIANGIRNARWPARLQRLTEGPLVGRLRPGWELWLDGGHNPAAGQMLAEVARGWQELPLHLVLGMLDNRDPVAFLAPLVLSLASVSTVEIPGQPNSFSAGDLAEIVGRTDLTARPSDDIGTAIDSILASSPAHGRILICGSLYLAGTVLTENR